MTNPMTAFFKELWSNRDKERLESMQSNNRALAAAVLRIQSNNRALAATASRIESNNKELNSAVLRMELTLLRRKSKKEQRYGILVDDKFVEALTALAKRTGKNKEDVIRDALNYYENSLNEWDEVNSPPPP